MSDEEAQIPHIVQMAGEEWQTAMIPRVLTPDEVVKWGNMHTDQITGMINEKGSFTPGVVILGSPTKMMPDEAKGKITVQLSLPILKFIAPDNEDGGEAQRAGAYQLTRITTEVINEVEGYAVMVAFPAIIPEDAETAQRLAEGKVEDMEEEGVIEGLVVTVETDDGFVTMRLFAIDRDENERASIAAELEMNDFQQTMFPKFMDTAKEYARQMKARAAGR